MPWLKTKPTKRRKVARKRALKALLKKRAPKRYGAWHSVGGDLEARLEDIYVVVRGKRAQNEKCFFSEGAVDVLKELFREPRWRENFKARYTRRGTPRPFSVLVYYKGCADGAFEREMKRVSRGRWGGSGYHFPTQTRDVEYTFTRRAAALAAAKRVKKLRRGLKVEVTGRVWP
jgi:hypothetical protein